MEKYIIECQNEQEWDAVNLKTGADLGEYTKRKTDYPRETVSIDSFKKQWSGSSFFKKTTKYNDYIFISAQKYLNPEFVPLIFN